MKTIENVTRVSQWSAIGSQAADVFDLDIFGLGWCGGSSRIVEVVLAFVAGTTTISPGD